MRSPFDTSQIVVKRPSDEGRRKRIFENKNKILSVMVSAHRKSQWEALPMRRTDQSDGRSIQKTLVMTKFSRKTSRCYDDGGRKL